MIYKIMDSENKKSFTMESSLSKDELHAHFQNSGKKHYVVDYPHAKDLKKKDVPSSWKSTSDDLKKKTEDK